MIQITTTTTTATTTISRSIGTITSIVVLSQEELDAFACFKDYAANSISGQTCNFWKQLQATTSSQARSLGNHDDDDGDVNLNGWLVGRMGWLGFGLKVRTTRLK